MAKSGSAGDVAVRHNEEADIFELGATIDGQFVAFSQLPAGDVLGRVADLKAASESASGEQPDETTEGQ